jgi:hypothetical protein
VIEHENALLLHAGVPPNWDKNTLLSQSFMVEKHLKKSAGLPNTIWAFSDKSLINLKVSSDLLPRLTTSPKKNNWSLSLEKATFLSNFCNESKHP